MIPRSPSNCQTENVTGLTSPQSIIGSDNTNNSLSADNTAKDCRWQTELAETSINVADLLDLLAIPEKDRHRVLTDQQLSTGFPLRVPHSYIARMARGDINDPLLKQVLPVNQESLQVNGYIADPLAETVNNDNAGIIHKYQGRALLLVTQACAIHCRYCFRRHFPYGDNTGNTALDKAFEYIESSSDIRELIFSGGDPLAVTDTFLSRIIERANKIKHLQRLRIHTRLPVVLPSRINDSLLDTLTRWRGQLVVVIHCNHPNELDDFVAASLRMLSERGITLLNQSVLLRGVNDCASTLATLSEKLFELGVMPYYLHQLDPVAGAHHFAVSDQQARMLIAKTSALLPGFLVPKLVREIPGKPAKTLL